MNAPGTEVSAREWEICLPRRMLRTQGKLTPVEIVVFLAIKGYAGPDGLCYPSGQQLAEDLGLSRATICRAIAVLVREGHVTRVSSGGGPGRATVYRVAGKVHCFPVDDLPHDATDCLNSEAECTPVCVTHETDQAPECLPDEADGALVRQIIPSSPPTNVPHQRDGVCLTDDAPRYPIEDTPVSTPYSPPIPGLEEPPTTTIRRRKKPNKFARKTYSQTFEAFWAVYPRAVAKAKAAEVFEEVLDAGIDHEVVIAAAKRYAREVAGRDQEHIAHASTWLNQRRWEDDGTPKRLFLAIPKSRHDV